MKYLTVRSTKCPVFVVRGKDVFQAFDFTIIYTFKIGIEIASIVVL